MKGVAFAAGLLCASAGFGMENRNAEWFIAAESDNLATIDRMIKEGMDLNIIGYSGKTALSCAAKNNDLKMVERLIEGNPSEVLNMVLE